MVDHYVPVSARLHASKGWKRPTNYSFAATQALAPIVGAELAYAVGSMPVGFVHLEGRYTLVAVLAPDGGRNMFVDAEARWIQGSYIPAIFRTRPFRLLRDAAGEKLVLCVDASSGLIVEREQGESFVDDAGQPSPALAAVIKMLHLVENGRVATVRAAAALQSADLLVPWEIKVAYGDTRREIEGLLKVDEQRLQRLSDTDFLELRKAGALPLAYAQLISMAKLDVFAQLARMHQQVQAVGRSETLEQILGADDGGILRFK